MLGIKVLKESIKSSELTSNAIDLLLQRTIKQLQKHDIVIDSASITTCIFTYKVLEYAKYSRTKKRSVSGIQIISLSSDANRYYIFITIDRITADESGIKTEYTIYYKTQSVLPYTFIYKGIITI